jgi:mercuric ion transport protein
MNKHVLIHRGVPMTVSSDTRSRRLTLGGAILAALAASSCCVGPLVLAALGVGGAGAFAAFASYRPYILGVTAVLLGGGFYLTYRKKPEGDACGCERPRAGRAARIGLWTTTAVVVLLAAAPQLLAAVAHERAVHVATTTNLRQVVLSVRGIDCEACAAPIRKALGKVGGFDDLSLDVKAQRVAVRFEPAPGRIEAYVAAIDELGYEASVVEADQDGKVTR